MARPPYHPKRIVKVLEMRPVADERKFRWPGCLGSLTLVRRSPFVQRAPYYRSIEFKEPTQIPHAVAILVSSLLERLQQLALRELP